MTSAGAVSPFPLHTETSEEHEGSQLSSACFETNAQASLLMSRDGAAVALPTMDAAARGVHQIMWLKIPSEIAAVSWSGQPEASFT